MRYGLNELLEEEDLMSLTEEAMGPQRKGRTWKRAAALAACGALVVCLANFQAIAEGIDRLWRYAGGVGTVPEDAQVLVQDGPAELVVGDRTYRVVNAYQQDELVHLTVEMLCYGDDQGEITLAAGLTCDGVACPNDYGERFGLTDLNVSVTQITPIDEWTEYFRELGYGDVMSRYEGVRATTGCAMTFRAGGGDTYEVSVYAGTPGPKVSIEQTFQGTIELKLKPSDELPAQPYTHQTEWGALTALVSGEGRRVQLVLEQPEEETVRAARLWPRSLQFVDELGNRYLGVPVQLSMDRERQAQEIEIEREPEASIVAIEIPAIEMMMEDTADPDNGAQRFSLAGEEHLDWTISLAE